MSANVGGGPSLGSPQPQKPLPPPGERFSLFVGSIADGVEDAWLEKILNVSSSLTCNPDLANKQTETAWPPKTAGPLIQLKRIRDASGKPKAFGFAEYGDPESVLRCLEVINGAKVPGDQEKAIVVRPLSSVLSI
jgi:RNA-binding protein 25